MRLIDADALEKEMCSGCEYNKNKYANCDDCAIANAPTIDIAEVCGECKPYEPCIYCKHEFENRFETCGAKMDGERREP